MGYPKNLKNELLILTTGSLLLAIGFFAWRRPALTSPTADNTADLQRPASPRARPLIDQQPHPQFETATFALG